MIVLHLRYVLCVLPNAILCWVDTKDVALSSGTGAGVSFGGIVVQYLVGDRIIGTPLDEPRDG